MGSDAMDISYRIKDSRFNLRVAGLLVSQNKLLLMKLDTTPYYFPPGGRVQLHESSADALKREWQEELGLAIEINKLAAVAESFFTEEVTGEQYHEVGFYYWLKPDIGALLPRQSSFERKDETGQLLYFLWQPLDALKDIYIRPPFIQQGLPAFQQEVIHLVEYQ